MGNDNSTIIRGGIGFIGLLTILFIGLKLTGHIGWSWVWVLSPIWILPVLIAVIITIIILIAIIIDKIDKLKKRKKNNGNKI